MKVLLIDIDSKVPNLALKKAELYHQAQGHEVVWNMPLMATTSDRIYVSCVFRENRHKAEQFEAYDHALIGGSGYDLHTELPPEIEAIKPRINMGFTTRGCVRKCPFCIVPEKEGYVRIVGDLMDLWDGTSKDVTLLDNNILALPEHFYEVCGQAVAHKLRLDFNQGLDHRLLTMEIAMTLKATRMKEYRFAYDSVNMRNSVELAIMRLVAVGIREAIWYVLTGYNTTIHDDLARLNHLKRAGHLAFVQRYRRTRELIPVARWANQRHIFRGMSFGQFLREPRKRDYYVSIYGDEYDRLLEVYA